MCAPYFKLFTSEHFPIAILCLNGYIPASEVLIIIEIFILCIYQVVVDDAATNEEIDKAVNFLSVFADEGQESFLSKVLKSEKLWVNYQN